MSTSAATRTGISSLLNSFEPSPDKNALAQRRAATWTWSIVTFLEQRVLCHLPESSLLPRFALFKLRAAVSEIAATLEKDKDAEIEGRHETEIDNVLMNTLETLARAPIPEKEMQQFLSGDFDNAVTELSSCRKRMLLGKLDKMRSSSELSNQARANAAKVEKALLHALAKPQIKPLEASLKKLITFQENRSLASIEKIFSEIRGNFRNLHDQFPAARSNLYGRQLSILMVSLGHSFRCAVQKTASARKIDVSAHLHSLSDVYRKSNGKLLESIDELDSTMEKKKRALEELESQSASDTYRENKALIKRAEELRKSIAVDSDKVELKHLTLSQSSQALRLWEDASKFYAAESVPAKPAEMFAFFQREAANLRSPTAPRYQITNELDSLLRMKANLEVQRSEQIMESIFIFDLRSSLLKTTS